MDPSNALQEHVADEALAPPPVAAEIRPAAILRGTARGLEIHVDGGASLEAIAAAVNGRLAEAPSFFRGSDVRVKVEDGPLAAGCLARLDDIAVRFDLRIVEVAAVKRAGRVDEDGVPRPNLAAGSAPAPAQPVAGAIGASDEIVELAAPAPALVDAFNSTPVASHANTPAAATAAAAATALELELEPSTAGTRLVVGPVRSGVILEHPGHLIIFGDVNPGAEVRAEGNIVVLGRLRGTAHAGIGQDVGFILSLRLEPQQLRIGRKVARAADSDTPASDAEIAYCTGDTIVVERYTGKLPRNLATSIE